MRQLNDLPKEVVPLTRGPYVLPFVSSNEVAEMFYVGRRNEHIIPRIGIG